MQTTPPAEAEVPPPEAVDPLPTRGSMASPGLWFIAFLLVAFAGVLLFYRAMGRDLNHDEHQFLAPSSLLSRQGLLPYRDYPLFHLPNIIFVYAAAERLWGDPIFGAKVVSSLSSAGVVALLFWIALARGGNGLRPWERLWVATAASTLLLCDPLFLYTAGKTWNHELPAFLLVAAFMFHVESFRTRPFLLTALSGLAAGLAAGTRLTYLPPCGAFLLHLALCGGETRRQRLQLLLIWASACATALLPSVYFYVTAHDAFVFDNLRFPRLRLLDPDNERIQKTMNWGRKIRFLLKEVATRSWPLASLYLTLGLLPFCQAFRHRRFAGGAIFSGLLGIMVILGCFAPSRYQYQHFYALAVVGAVGIVYRCKEGIMARWARRSVLVGMGALAVVSVIGYLSHDPRDPRPNGWRAYLEARAMRDPAVWFSNRYRQQYAVLQRYVPAGERVLTLAPAAVLAAGRNIYPEFATGPFAWRSAQFVPPALREKYHYVAPEDLNTLLLHHPPAAILTGVEEAELEQPFINYATAQQFQKVDLPKGKVLWIPERQGIGRP